jgi:arylsulfatase A-like enzyme
MIKAICCGLIALAACSTAAAKPNILILYADDLGYANLGVTGGEVKTPHIDSLAAGGVRFTNGYVSGCVCSPSRAGLLTGRYQQRFGFDANAEGERKSDRAPRGIDLKETTFEQRLKAAGYATGLVGKWNLGGREGYRPLERGFDEFYGLLPHGIGKGNRDEEVTVYRGTQPVATPEDHTIAFGQEGQAFIERHRERPWFLYMAFTAVHAPQVSPEAYLKKFESIADKRKRAYYAMISLLDDTIGSLLATLRKHQLEENTLIFFASDNGGPLNGHVDNGPYSGGKWSLWEGGIRSPLMIQWKGRIAGGRQLPQMVNQLDWLPTALAAAEVPIDSAWRLDGVNLLPLLEGKSAAAPHEALFWRFGVQYAVRRGDWKLLKPSIDDAPKLFNLAADPGEENDLTAQQPQLARELQALWDQWNAGNEPPRWQDDRWNGLEQKQTVKRAKKGARE